MADYNSIDHIQEFQLDQDELNQELEKLVHEKMERDRLEKEQHSNIGGWQSERDLHTKLDINDPSTIPLIKLLASFSDPINEYLRECCEISDIKSNKNYEWEYTGTWFNVSVREGYNAPHTHPLSEISGAYYVRTEDPPPEHPFSGRIDFFYKNISEHYFPKPGTLILFPGTMLHFVHPYYGTNPRICFSFNTNKIHIIE